MNLTFFCNDYNNWNYNAFINTPNADPYNLKRTINISSNNSYNLMKYNAVNMLKEILKHTSQYLNDDVKEWIYKKALQGSKNDSLSLSLLFLFSRNVLWLVHGSAHRNMRVFNFFSFFLLFSRNVRISAWVCTPKHVRPRRSTSWRQQV
jgi:hypothetical protein